jgi:hypothetical protein
MADRMLDKIAKLLNQAESSKNDHEAETFLKAAQRLATQESIDLAVARQHTAKKEQREQPTQKWIRLGVQGAKNNKYLVRLFLAVGGNNGLKHNIAHDSVGVYAYGMPSDIDLAEVIYGALAHQMVEAANAYLKSGEYKKEIVGWKYDRKSDSYVDKPMDGRVARANFYEGFIQRVSNRLFDARMDAEREAEERTVKVLNEEGNETETTGALVLVRKREEVNAFYDATSTARGSWKGTSGPSTYSGASRTAGNQAGGRARIGSSKAIGGSRTQIG